MHLCKKKNASLRGKLQKSVTARDTITLIIRCIEKYDQQLLLKFAHFLK